MISKRRVAPAAIETVLNVVNQIGARRLVINSSSALAQAFKDVHEVRIIPHTVLSKVTRLMGYTTIIIMEMPDGGNRMSLGIEGSSQTI